MTASPISIVCRCGRFLQAPRTLAQWELKCPNCGCALERCEELEEVPPGEGEAAQEVEEEAVVDLLEPSGGRGLAIGFVSLMWAAAILLAIWVGWDYWGQTEVVEALLDDSVSQAPQCELIPLAPLEQPHQYSER